MDWIQRRGEWILHGFVACVLSICCWEECGETDSRYLNFEIVMRNLTGDTDYLVSGTRQELIVDIQRATISSILEIING